MSFASLVVTKYFRIKKFPRVFYDSYSSKTSIKENDNDLRTKIEQK